MLTSRAFRLRAATTLARGRASHATKQGQGQGQSQSSASPSAVQHDSNSKGSQDPQPSSESLHQSHSAKDENATKSVAERDAELQARLLDRDGGNAGFQYVNGKPEGGLGPETKKNMFRVI